MQNTFSEGFQTAAQTTKTAAEDVMLQCKFTGNSLEIPARLLCTNTVTQTYLCLKNFAHSS